jgi:hypothetical protein
MNEPRETGRGSAIEWGSGDSNSWNYINRLNETFVRTVRAQGSSQNRERLLMLPGYCASSSYDAIANIKLDDSGCNFDPETLKPLLNQLNAIYQQLLSMGKDVSDIKLGINLVASLVEPLGADVSAIYNLLVTNMPKFFEKADEIIDAINKHKCCECNCNGNNHNEGLIDDITSLMNC